ncbi:MAG: hypothetical protein IH941_01400 [Acidobacteria bacterium]|nr:hypothetical protein [Acidobacteriota bacterium]
MSVPLPSPSRRARRVVDSHQIVAAAFRLAGLFILGAASWSLYRAFDSGSWWGPLHTFMAGAVLLAISGATQLFSVTWAASVPPDPRLAATQRWFLALGVVAVIAGVVGEVTALVVVGTALVVLGLLLLAWILIGVRRRSLLKRFGLSSRFYVLGITAGTIGVTLGGLLGSGIGGSRYLDFRTAHMHLNLVGLVGFTIVGTLPTILPTMVRHKMVSGREAVVGFWLSAFALALMAAGALAGPVVVGVGCGLAGAGAAATLIGILARLGIPKLLSSGLPAALVSAGSAWFIGWTVLRSVSLVGGHQAIWSRATAVGVGGVALVLFGSLAYLVPVLAGPGSNLAANFERMRGSPWARFALANGAVAAAALGLPGAVALVLGAAFLTDFGIRTIAVLTRGRR